MAPLRLQRCDVLSLLLESDRAGRHGRRRGGRFSLGQNQSEDRDEDGGLRVCGSDMFG